MKLRTYVHTYTEDGKDKIDCICLKENKGCDRPCEEQEIIYSEYQDLMECFRNGGKKDYECY